MTSTLPITDDELPALFAGLERIPLALAVSGGADSMALMHLIARWAAREDVRAAWSEHWLGEFDRLGIVSPQRLAQHAAAPPRWLDGMASLEDLRQAGGPPHVVVLTVDHGLRAAAAEEAAFVAREASKLGLARDVLRWDGEKPATGIQDAARSARRILMLDVLRAEQEWLTHRAGVVRSQVQQRALVMAHHQEDQAETLLMRLARGSGLDGLRGMRARDRVTRAASSERSRSYSVALLRPLLGVPKARLIATLRNYSASWFEDPSNADERFERVRIRKALCQLEPLGFTAEKIALSARRLADAEIAFERLFEEADAMQPQSPARELFADLDLTRPDFASRYTAGRLLRRVLAMYGGAARLAELAQIEELAARTIQTGSASCMEGVTLGGCKLQPHGEGRRILRIFREGCGEGLPVVPVDREQVVDWDGGRFTIEAGGSAPDGATVRALGMQGWADLKRAVKGLGDLGWPAAAMATVPVIECGGGIIAYPVIDQAVRRLQEEKRQTKERWAALASELRQVDYHVTFNVRSW